ncbi:MAG: hypothetical protein Q8O95_02400 [bacterium]|nr:hypothetical protein [bacterium]
MKIKNNNSILKVLQNPVSLLVALGFAFLFFDLQYLMMSRLPGSVDDMCVPGAGLNPSNITFSIALSILAGIVIIGLYETIRMKGSSIKDLSASGLGALVGTFTVFCPICTLPILSVLGLSVGFGFFNTYNIWLKILSLALMTYALYDLNKQISGHCDRCVS